MIFETPVCNVPLDGCTDCDAARRLQVHALDSLRSLAWLDGELWTEMRALFLEWAERQFDRDYIVFRSRREPAFLYDCSECDSVIRHCADVLTGPADRFVDEVRRYWKAQGRTLFARDSNSLNNHLAYVDARLNTPDSLREAREALFRLLSNHLNHRIHQRLGTNGAVDFGIYESAFLQSFDSVHVETWEP
ncbi:MAG: hypothetical protein NC250_06330 [Alistipes senegalensis]|nr:hypothetical protein [Bacteroides cellulosilyticus]MCM1352331.1 hypothetical protein [Alistipes senegalensis]